MALNSVALSSVLYVNIINERFKGRPFGFKETDEPKRDTASTDPETGDEEIRSAGQQQGTVDVTSVITEAKEVYDKAMLPTFPAPQVL